MQQERNGHDPLLPQCIAVDSKCAHFQPWQRARRPLDLSCGGVTGSDDLREINQTVFQSQLLTSADQKVTKACLKQVISDLEEHNIRHRFEKLVERCNRAGRCVPDDEQIFQALCTQLCEVAKRADMSCK